MKKVVYVTIALVLVLVMVAPVVATKPEDTSITVRARYFFWDFYNPAGSWYSDGLIVSAGDHAGVLSHFGAGWPPGVGFKTAHAVEVLGDENGTITISTQGHDFEFVYGLNESYGDGDDTYDESFEGIGNWVILSGTGAYSNLHGQGTAIVRGKVDWDAWIMDIEEDFVGMAHFDG